MNERPTRVRYRVLFFACALSMITYLDRACFGAVAHTLAGELAVENLKWAFTAFALGYAIFEVPAGWLGDVWGPRRTLLRIVLWWSLFTALTALVGYKVGSTVIGGLGLLVVLRFLFGAGEAGAYPNITRALYNWFPINESSTAQGWVWMSGRLMAGITPLVWTVLVHGTAWTPAMVTWREAFVLFGLLGAVWCVAFAMYFRDLPSEHSDVNAAELQEIEAGRFEVAESAGPVPWRCFLRSANLWTLCAMYFFMVYGWAFNLTYYPAYLQDRYGVDSTSLLGAIYKGGPLWMGALGCFVGGYLVDALIRRTGNRMRVRRSVGIAGQSLCALGWIAAIFAPNEHMFFLAVSLAALCNDLTLASTWAACQDIGQRYTALTAACMNTIGTLGAAVAGWLTGTIVEQTLIARAAGAQLEVTELSGSARHAATMAGFDYCFMTFALVYILSAIGWRYIDTTKPIVNEPA